MDATMSVMCLYVIIKFFCLTMVFQLKHFVADYLLQNEYMLGKFKESGWIKPLAAHCAVHAWITYVILLLMCPWLSAGWILLLVILDFVIHFAMDRIKASPSMLGKYEALTKNDFKDHLERIAYWESQEHAGDWWREKLGRVWEQRKKSNKFFWIALGVDQMIHHITHDLIIFIVMVLWVLTPVI